MTGLLSNSQRAKALGNKEEQKGATASTPNYALTTGDVVIDGMTTSRVGSSLGMTTRKGCRGGMSCPSKLDG
jgi:hypothetical protein